MGELELNSRIHCLGKTRAWITVNHGNQFIGTLVVETEHAGSLTDYLNAYPHGTVGPEIAKAEGATP